MPFFALWWQRLYEQAENACSSEKSEATAGTRRRGARRFARASTFYMSKLGGLQRLAAKDIGGNMGSCRDSERSVGSCRGGRSSNRPSLSEAHDSQAEGATPGVPVRHNRGKAGRTASLSALEA